MPTKEQAKITASNMLENYGNKKLALAKVEEYRHEEKGFGTFWDQVAKYIEKGKAQ